MSLLLLLYFLDHVFVSHNMYGIEYRIEIPETVSSEGVVVSPDTAYIM